MLKHLILSIIYTGDARTLSMRSLAEKVFNLERQFGGIVKGSFIKAKLKQKKDQTSPVLDNNLPEKLRAIKNSSIYSFSEGMSQMPATLTNQLKNDSNIELRECNRLLDFKLDEDGKLNLNIQNDKQQTYQIKAEHVFFACNSSDLANLIPNQLENLSTFKQALNTIKSTSVATINFEFNKRNIIHEYPGFGFLIPSIVNSSILGVIFDSSSFSEFDGTNKITSLTVCTECNLIKNLI